MFKITKREWISTKNVVEIKKVGMRAFSNSKDGKIFFSNIIVTYGSGIKTKHEDIPELLIEEFVKKVSEEK